MPADEPDRPVALIYRNARFDPLPNLLPVMVSVRECMEIALSKVEIHEPHELPEEFPEFVDKLRAMNGNPVFDKLAAAYHKINHEIILAEANVEPTDDFHLEDMRKERLKLKDAIFDMLRH
jgi:uncharacterized protein YdcH (DUF465 family)